MSMSGLEMTITLVGLTVITVVTRSFFFLSEKELSMPAWLKRGLRYAPLAAVAAVVLPEIVMQHGELIETFHDARLYGAAAATAYFFWRRDILGTIVTGMAVLLPLRLGLGW